jgi:hypothetical protein
VEPAPTRATSAEPSHSHATLPPTRDKNPDDGRNDHGRERSGLIGEHGLNVDGQVLATRGQLGHVVTDVNGTMPPSLLASLRSLPETVRLMTFSQRP